MRVCTCDVRNRRAYACIYRGCKKGMDVARMGPGEHRCHARDLSALVDLVSHGYEEVGTCRKQRVKVGHHAVLPDEAMRPVEAGVQGASYHLALAVDAGGPGGKISRQSAEVCEYAVLPKSGKEGCAVRAADFPNNLALVVNAGGEIGTWASGVNNSRFRISYDLSAVIDIAGRPVIPAQRRESAHVFVLPKKRTTRFPRGEGASVFAVRIWIRCFGHTDRFPAIVDPAPVHPTVRSSERGEVDRESVSVYHRVAPSNWRKNEIADRVHEPIHDQR